MTTKKEIIETAHTLFNENGYTNTSMRDISQALSISVGNLTYHFRKKEDILKELCQIDFYQDRKSFSDHLTLEDFDAYLYGMVQSVEDNRFYFTDPKIHSIAKDILHENLDDKVKKLQLELEKYLEDLSHQNIFPYNEEQCHSIAQILMFSHIGWIQSRTIYTMEEMMRMQWDILMIGLDGFHLQECKKITAKYQK